MVKENRTDKSHLKIRNGLQSRFQSITRLVAGTLAVSEPPPTQPSGWKPAKRRCFLWSEILPHHRTKGMAQDVLDVVGMYDCLSNQRIEEAPDWLMSAIVDSIISRLGLLVWLAEQLLAKTPYRHRLNLHSQSYRSPS